MVEDRRRCGWSSVVAAVAVFATLLLTVPATPAVAGPADGRVSVVVRHEPGRGAEVERLVQRLGGRVVRRLGIIDGLAATVPSSASAGCGPVGGWPR